MKWSVKGIAFAAVLLSVLGSPAFSQNYYLVIGAFATEKDDIREFTSYLPGTVDDTAYTVNTNNNIMHFYVLKSSDKDIIMSKTQKLQQELDNDSHVLSSIKEYHVNSTTPADGIKPSGAIMEPETVTASSGKSAFTLPSAGGIPMKPKGQFFKFTISKDDGSSIRGEVHYVDLEKGRELASFTSDSYVDLLRPGKNKAITVVCGVFGYKEVEKFIDYSNPSLTEGAHRDEEGAWIIPYTLERLEKGDVSVMYNASFFKDAVVMLPQSKQDLDELVNLMNLNPGYVIRVHAHCNGRNSRKIISLGSDKNYFDVAGSVQKKGSAKELTNLRGEAVKSYLMDHGISEKRIKVYGWGGSEMLVEKDSQHAKLNDRIEIEILKD